MPVLEKIIGFSKIEQFNKSTESLFCECLSQNSFPSYPLAVLQRLGESLPADGFWMIATPVHLLLQRDTFCLLHPSEIKLNLVELSALIATLNQHFSQDGIFFEVSPAGICYLRLPNEAGVVTSSPYLAAGQSIDQHLPKGAGSGLFNRVLNEIQMLMFDHPINQAREARGELAVNGFWLHGEGVQFPDGAFESTTLIADHLLAGGLAKAGRITLHSPIGYAESIKDQASYIAVLDADDQVETNWLMPALKALRSFKLQSLEIFVTANGRTIKASSTPLASLKLWSAPKSLESIFYHGFFHHD